MKVTDKDVLYVADLANLELTESERGRMVKDLNSILDHMTASISSTPAESSRWHQLSDRYGVDESKTGTARFAYAMRTDEPHPSLPHDDALRNAPHSDGTSSKCRK